MAGLVEQFLAPRLQREWEVLSVGCGAGMDVLNLRSRGYAAFGLDPSRLTLEMFDDDTRTFFRQGTAEDRPFGARTFDYVFSLDVIEHVGCEDFGVKLRPDAGQVRRDFIKACADALKPGGRLLLTTSNKLFPIDIGHWHSYHAFGSLFPKRQKLGLSLPWSPSNFLVSVTDLRRLVEDAVHPRRFKIELGPVARYPKTSRREDLVGLASRTAFGIADLPGLRGGVLAPLIAPEIHFLD